METLNAKSLNVDVDVDSDDNKPKDFPANGQLITDETENLKSALTSSSSSEQGETRKDGKRDNRSISTLLKNYAAHDATAVTQNGNCDDADDDDGDGDDDSEARRQRQFQRERQPLLILDSLAEKKSPCSKNGPMIETVSDGLTNIAIEENGSERVDESGVSKRVGDNGESSQQQQQISVVRLSQNGDITQPQQNEQQQQRQRQSLGCAQNVHGNENGLDASSHSPCCPSHGEPPPPHPPPPQQPHPQQGWCSPVSLSTTLVSDGISYVRYEDESQMPDIMRLITKDLSEPYSIYTYRYFIHNWPKLCFLAMDEDKCVGAIVCKLDVHKKMANRGYIAMLAVDTNYRRRRIGSTLVRKAIRAMILDEASSCDEVVLETEITNTSALRLYENLGFVRDKRLFRYYLNGVDALRLKLWLR